MTQSRQQKARRAGAWAEQMVAEYLARWWPLAERRRLTGVHDKGDIAAIAGTVVEIKNEQRIDLSGYLTELEREMVNAKAEHGVVVIRRRGTTDVGCWYACMTVAEWVRLRRALDRP